MIKVLELFAGSRSWGKVAEELGYDVFSVDWKDFDGIDLVIDILELKKEMIPFKPDMIWASPPCTYFSVASIGVHWFEDHTPKTKEALSGMEILNKTLEILAVKPTETKSECTPKDMQRKVAWNLILACFAFSFSTTKVKPSFSKKDAIGLRELNSP